MIFDIIRILDHVAFASAIVAVLALVSLAIEIDPAAECRRDRVAINAAAPLMCARMGLD